MNGANVVEAALRREPELLRSLVHQLAGIEIEGPLSLVSDAPLAAFRSAQGPWLAVAALDRVDEASRARWLLAVASLNRATGADGDLVILASSKRAARWARRPLRRRGPLGTRLRLDPVVVQLGLPQAESLVEGPSALGALAAAWAIQRKFGPRSRAVARSIIGRLDEIDPSDRSWWLLATLQLLNGPQLAHIEVMRHDLPRSEAFSQFCNALEAQAEARGKARSLLRFLELRRVPLSPEQRSFMEECSDLTVINAWTEAVFSASSTGAMLEAVFGPPTSVSLNGLAELATPPPPAATPAPPRAATPLPPPAATPAPPRAATPAPPAAAPAPADEAPPTVDPTSLGAGLPHPPAPSPARGSGGG